MSVAGRRQCLVSGEPFVHLLHNSLGGSALPRWHQPAGPGLTRPQRQASASASVLQQQSSSSGTSVAEASSRPSLQGIAEGIRSGQRSATEVTEEYLQRIERVDPRLLSYLAVNKEGALSAAHSVDQKVAEGSGASLGALAGVPISVKDNILTQGIETTAASRILSGELGICSCSLCLCIMA